MDEIDRRLLRDLQANGRITNQELAHRNSLSPALQCVHIVLSFC